VLGVQNRCREARKRRGCTGSHRDGPPAMEMGEVEGGRDDVGWFGLGNKVLRDGCEGVEVLVCGLEE
jgi:hypothetical protein